MQLLTKIKAEKVQHLDSTTSCICYLCGAMRHRQGGF